MIGRKKVLPNFSATSERIFPRQSTPYWQSVTLVYGILSLINFAQRVLCSNLLCFYMIAIFMLPWWLSVIISVYCALLLE